MSEASLVNGNGGDESVDSANSGIRDLETRNQELAATVDQHVQINRQLTLQLQQLQAQCKRFQEQLEKERQEVDIRCNREQAALKEQLQVHIQTIGILVSEKSDLQSAVAQSRSSLKQKSDEADQLLSRLQASRQRVAELERNLSSATSSSQQYEKSSKSLDKERDTLKLDVYKLKKSKEELSQQNSELSNQLRAKTSETSNLEQTLNELRERLSMSELRVQQLASSQGNQLDYQQQLQQVQEEKIALEDKLKQYNQSFQQLTAEREQLAQQYQQHMVQLQQQLQQLSTQLTGVAQERDQLAANQVTLQNTIMSLQNAKEEEKPMDVNSSQGPSISNEELDRLQQRIQQLEKEHQSMQSQYQAQVNDNSQLSRLYQEKEERVDQLEETLSRLKEESSDRATLLESIQSDKATISRALAQNKQLKTQLEELQTAFVKMSNDNMQAHTALSSEQHINKELAQRLGQQEQELEETRTRLSSNEQQCENLKSQTYELNKQLLQHAQITDRAQHIQAHGHITEQLQRDLTSSQEKVQALSSENSELRVRIANLETYRPPPSASSVDNPDSSHNPGDSSVEDDSLQTSRGDMVDSLSAAIRQLEMERDQLSRSVREEQEKHRRLLAEMEVKQQQDGPAILQAVSENAVTREALETLQEAMDLLQTRFTQVMREKADIIDRCQELEHQNLQLAGETETIGEYITLYHNQRDMMKRRQEDRERYVAMLANEKEDMQAKLEQLQNLVMQLLQEKQHLHQYPPTPRLSPNMTNSITPRDHPNAFKVKRAKELGGSMDSSTLDDYGDDWSSTDSDPDMGEDAAMEDDDSNYYQIQPLTPNSTSHPADKLMHNHHHHEHNHVPTGEHTAHQIIQLLQQMGGATEIDRSSILDHELMPCKCCSGGLITV
ncbi:golgin subfamily A member 2-like [Amphiura filiformis]|uniref:golgin subfamily A member 2-like n=1 Tax=Amphiura filiformis TaxID=82378 RepID=UPI003B212236